MEQSTDGLPHEEHGLQNPEEANVFDRVESLSRLRDRVEQAANEITRLRKENADLADRILTLESSQPAEYSGGIDPDENPEVMREKIDRFIEAIDSYLDEDADKQSE